MALRLEAGMDDKWQAYQDERYVESPASCYFYHTIDLPDFGVQDGGWDLRGRYQDYIGHADLAAKRVLDVGTASGFLTFEAERLGAASVVSFDMDTAERQHLLPFADGTYVMDYPTWVRDHTAAIKAWHRSYWLSHRLLGSKAKMRYGDIYKLPSDIGRFDVIILGAILEHLRDPLAALREVARVTDDLVIINTDYFGHPLPVAVFNGRVDNPAKSYCFWTYSIALYDEYMAIMGFKKITERRDQFAGTRPAPGDPRPMLDRVALVYQRQPFSSSLAPAGDLGQRGNGVSKDPSAASELEDGKAGTHSLRHPSTSERDPRKPSARRLLKDRLLAPFR